MKLSDIRQVLDTEGIQLTKSLGQNFLHDANQLARILSAAQLTPTDQVLEIGPGLGPLTQLLVEKSAHVLAIEKDRRLVDFLERRFATERRLTLIHADALEFLERESHDWTGWKVVSNLPYSVGSSILVRLAQEPKPPKRLVVTLQLEVAQRLLALPASRDYGVLTLLIQLVYEPDGFFKIPSPCFFPAPGVDSACVTLLARPNQFLVREQQATFQQIVKRGFSQRRKMMFKLLKTDWSAANLEAAFAEIGLSREIRAERVSLDQFVGLTHFLQQRRQEKITP